MLDDFRFWLKVRKTDGCWFWTGSTDHGYGRVRRLGRSYYAHRWVYFLSKEEHAPDDLDVCHQCDTPLCVRPDHLFLGTAKDNTTDCATKGRRANFAGERNANAKLSRNQVDAIRHDYRPGYGGLAKLARQYGVTRNLIWLIVTGRAWKSDGIDVQIVK